MLVSWNIFGWQLLVTDFYYLLLLLLGCLPLCLLQRSLKSHLIWMCQKISSPKVYKCLNIALPCPLRLLERYFQSFRQWRNVKVTPQTFKTHIGAQKYSLNIRYLRKKCNLHMRFFNTKLLFKNAFLNTKVFEFKYSVKYQSIVYA